MSTTTNVGTSVLDDLRRAQLIVEQIGESRISNVNVGGNTHARKMSIHPADPTDGRHIASALGLTPQRKYSDFQTWAGEYAGVPVVVFGSVDTPEVTL